jgi:hypothetical protein
MRIAVCSGCRAVVVIGARRCPACEAAVKAAREEQRRKREREQEARRTDRGGAR